LEQQSHYISPETSSVSWGARTGSVSTANTSLDSPVTELTEFSCVGGAEPDINVVPDLFPSSEAQKRGSDSSERPPKRNRLDATAAAKTTNGPVTKSKDPRPPVPIASDAGKPGPKTKAASSRRSSDKSRSSSSSAAPSYPSAAQSKTPQLRTASRKPKTRGKEPGSASPDHSCHDEEDPLTSDERRARHSHNLVEKQYRNRLNKHFESLLAVLPRGTANNRSFLGGGGRSRPNDARTPAGAGGAAEGHATVPDDRRLSKAEVLELAKERIIALRRENARLKSQRLELAASVDVVRDAVARGGIAGVVAAAAPEE
jgi:hypothetical protein